MYLEVFRALGFDELVDLQVRRYVTPQQLI